MIRVFFILVLASANAFFVESSTECCSWDFVTCAANDHTCNASKETCETTCGGFWVDPSKSHDGCTVPHNPCQNSAECCSDKLTCQIVTEETGVHTKCLVSTGTEPTYENYGTSTHCCSWNLMDCDKDTDWCNIDVVNCEEHCWGFWVENDPHSNETCQERWAPCVQDSDCCNDANHPQTCQHLEGREGSYLGCELADQNPQGNTKGCFDVSPDFSCEDTLKWKHCFIAAYNDAFEEIAYINDIEITGECDEGRRNLENQRHLRKSGGKRRRKVKASGDCKKCGDETFLPGDCFGCGRRALIVEGRELKLDANTKFKYEFYECLSQYLPQKIQHTQVADVYLNTQICDK